MPSSTLTSRDALDRYFSARRVPLLGAVVFALALAIPPAYGDGFHRPPGRQVFQRAATFPVFLNTDEGKQTAAEIVSVAPARWMTRNDL